MELDFELEDGLFRAILSGQQEQGSEDAHETGRNGQLADALRR